MTEIKYIIDKNSNYRACVAVKDGKVWSDELRAGETLIEGPNICIKVSAGDPGYIKPHWDGSAWKEGATAKEIAAWEKAHPIPQLPQRGKTLEEVAAYLNETAQAVMLLSLDI